MEDRTEAGEDQPSTARGFRWAEQGIDANGGTLLAIGARTPEPAEADA
jgi:hypothetical protein